MKRAGLLAAVLMVFSAGWGVAEPPRGWRTADGRAFQAEIVGVEGAKVIFRASDGRRSTFPLEQLAPEDRQFVADWRGKPPVKMEMPEVVGVDTADIRAEVVSEDERNEKFVYRTQHFEFESQGKFTQGLLREVARNFEATYELLKVLPWGIDPRPDSGGYFRARLFRTRLVYEAEGGPKNSGGVYQRRNKIFMVPFDSIGLKLVGKSYAKDLDFDTSTLVHELTHQMMHSWLGLLPQWIIEGTAEYTGALPLKLGRFRVSAAKTGLRNYLEAFKRGRGVPLAYPLEELFPITNEKWNEILEKEPLVSGRLYFTSFLLVYYFMHLDGAGDGELFLQYFREVDKTRREIEAYFKAVEEFKKLPGVTAREDGGYSWKEGLVPPERPAILASEAARDEFQKRTLNILLNGRSEEELMREIRSAYIKQGIRL